MIGKCQLTRSVCPVPILFPPNESQSGRRLLWEKFHPCRVPTEINYYDHHRANNFNRGETVCMQHVHLPSTVCSVLRLHQDHKQPSSTSSYYLGTWRPRGQWAGHVRHVRPARCARLVNHMLCTWSWCHGNHRTQMADHNHSCNSWMRWIVNNRCRFQNTRTGPQLRIDLAEKVNHVFVS